MTNEQRKERPILFSAPMVRALLAGTKTQTRRIVKTVGNDGGFVIVEQDGGAYWPHRSDDGESCFVTRRERDGDYLDEAPMRCPYGQPGDLLWVREAWRVCGGREYEYQRERAQVMYRATHAEDGFPLGWESYKWRPSIHMPRWASRITLEITGVRVERLQDISELDAAAEGTVTAALEHWRAGGTFPSLCSDQYRDLWNRINGPGSWDENPWVWVLAFSTKVKGR